MFGFTPQATTSVSNYVEYASTVTSLEKLLGTLQAGVLQPSAEGTRSVNGTVGVTSIRAFLDVKGGATSFVSGDSFTTAVNDFVSVYGKARIVPSTASATFVVQKFADVDAKATLQLGSVSNNFIINGVDYDAQARAFPPYATVSGDAGTPTTITVNYDFTPFTEDYDRSRTVYLNSINRANTVYIKK